MPSALSAADRSRAREALAHPGSIVEIASAQGLAPEALLGLCRAYLAEKADPGPAETMTRVRNGAEIRRDARGVPHIRAQDPHDLFFALGYAQAQDRLWHLDYLRRLADGTLAAILGPSRLADDILARTLDIPGVADRTTAALKPESAAAHAAFAEGVNAWRATLPNGLPAEFEWLGYEPAPWSARDSVAVLRRWWWYLTGRLHVLSTPEVIRASLSPELAAAYFTPDSEVTYILPEGSYPTAPAWPALPADPRQTPSGGGEDGLGSNNWAASKRITKHGGALFASDPHVYYTVPAEWYEARLEGAGFDVAGCAYPGAPAFLYGRTRGLAWGVTNNISLLRDLYVEELHPTDDARYRTADGSWRTMEERPTTIAVKGQEPVTHVTRIAHGRPVVDHLVPDAAHPRALWNDARTALSLAWVGFEPGDEVQCLLDLDRAQNIADGAEALRGWRCPTFNFLLADADGKVAYQSTGAIPLRERPWVGYRRANAPEDRWQGHIPFDGMPKLVDPARGWVGSANNPVARPDYPYPLAGAWSPEDRAGRVATLMEARKPHTLEGFQRMLADDLTGRGLRAANGIAVSIGTPSDPREAAALRELTHWDGHLTVDSAGGAIYNVFFWRWHERVMAARFAGDREALARDSGNGLSAALLHENIAGWFRTDSARIDAIAAAFSEAVRWLSERLGPEPATWRWGALHQLGGTHPAATTPLQHALLDIPPSEHHGGTSTLANAHFGPPGSFGTRLGASYRILADLADRASMQVVCWPGQSGHAGSAHYADQVATYLADGLFDLPLTDDALAAAQTGVVRLTPGV
jgi:penicillin amidase